MSQNSCSKPNPEKQICVHPILFAVYPVLFIYTSNFVDVDAGQLIRPIVIMASLTGFLWWSIRRFGKDTQKGSLFLSAGLLILFSYGPVSSLLERSDFRLSADSMTMQEITLGGVYLGLILGALYLIRAKRLMGHWTYLMNVLGTVLVAFALVQGGSFTYQRFAGFKLLPGAEGGAPATDMEEHASIEHPSVYFIILDGYGRGDVLRQVYGCSNSDFLDDLRELGFTVAERSSSNYSRTLPSLAATLNFAYLDSLVEPISEHLPDHRGLRELMWRNRTVRFLRAKGYSLVTTSTLYEGVSLGQVADLHLKEWWFPSSVELAVAGMMPLPTLARIAGWPLLYDLHRHRNLFALDQLPRVGGLPGPKFVYSHIFAPHPPFVISAEGEEIHPNRKFSWNDGLTFLDSPGASKSEYYSGYCAQTAFLNREITRVVSELLARSADPPIIILQGDHGPMSRRSSSLDSPNFLERFGILNAMYLPNGMGEYLSDDITAVNTFRFIFDHYFGTDLDLLENRNYFVSWEEPYRYLAVTADMSALIEPEDARRLRGPEPGDLR